MSRYIRDRTAGGTFFFTATLEDRSSSLLTTNIDALRSAFHWMTTRHPVAVDAMVILPDHLHAIWTLPENDADFAMRWMLFKGAFTRTLAKAGALGSPELRPRGRGERTLWQHRYWEHQIRNEHDFVRHVEYVHFNPVKHGWVAKARDWPFSTFHRYVKQGRLAEDWGVAASAGDFGE